MKLHEYQKFSVKYIEDHPESGLFLDCGLGKTVIALTALFDLMLDSFLVRKALIIAPLRVARDIRTSELAKWRHLDGLNCSVAVGDENKRKSAFKQKTQIYVINRENVDWLINKSGVPFDFDMAVIDELSSFKAWNSKRFKALCKVRPKLKRIVGLTGTPAPNGLMDLWAQIGLLDMGKRLGRYITHFRNRYFEPDKRNGMQIFSYKPKFGAEKQIYKMISDITVSMKNTDYLKFPEIVFNDFNVKLSDSEMKCYKTLKKELVLSLGGKEIDAVNAAALSGKLLQMANGAVYDDEKSVIRIHDRKLDALEDLIEAANGKPILAAYWFKHDFERIKQRLNSMQVKFSKLDSPESFKAWNEGNLPVALIHPGSAGHGVNLQFGGSGLVWFGLTWSLELYRQTNARLWRQGQKETVVIHHIISKDTIDEDAVKSLNNKDKSQSALIEAVKAELRAE
jgi:SNF2 family DNA or RNA helicase